MTTSDSSSSTTITESSSTSSVAAPAQLPATQIEPSLVSFASGVLFATRPKEYGGSWTAQALIDERADNGWASPENVVSPHVAVLALPERTELARLEFDTASIDEDGRGAKDVTVEISDTSATEGFKQIGKATLRDKADRQSFPVTANVPGRWVRLTILNNHGATDFVELMDFRGYGRQLTTTPFSDASGTYAADFGNFHLKQEGTSVTGCYESNEGLLSGGIEGRVMKFTWREGDARGPALMVFSPDGRQMFGIWGTGEGAVPMDNIWNGTKISSQVGDCPHWSSKGGAQERMTKELEELGRTRVYGINFDTDSDVLKSESKPTLDKIAALLKSKSDWSLAIEGHTDNTGGEAHNQQLSEKRAAAVKTYLVTSGVDTERLTTAGLGATVSLGDNATAAGRAQNRRVELAKK